MISQKVAAIAVETLRTFLETQTSYQSAATQQFGCFCCVQSYSLEIDLVAS
jgi:hypothetical protein